MLLVTFAFAAVTTATFIVPQPKGPYGVSLTDLQFTDTERVDPYTGANERTVPISLITPTGPLSQCEPVQQAYMPNGTAKFLEGYYGSIYKLSFNDTLSQTNLSLCKTTPNTTQYPLIFFSPGLGGSRQLYSIIATNLASQGFVVVTLDTPGEDPVTTYLNGTTTYNNANFTTTEQYDAAVDVRVKDLEFVFRSLSNHTSSSSSKSYSLNTSCPIVFGHSFGGATAASTIWSNDEFLGGADLDGSLFGVPLNSTTDKPFLILSSDDPKNPHNQTILPTWYTGWQNMHGPKWQMDIVNSTHEGYTDVPTLAQVWKLDQKLPEGALAQLLGNVTAEEQLDIEISVMTTLAQYLFGRANVTSVLSVADSFGDSVVVQNATNVGTTIIT